METSQPNWHQWLHRYVFSHKFIHESVTFRCHITVIELNIRFKNWIRNYLPIYFVLINSLHKVLWIINFTTKICKVSVMRNSNKAPKFSSMTEYELQNFYSNKKEGRKNVRQELSIYIVWSSAAINLGPRWKRGHSYITSSFFHKKCVYSTIPAPQNCMKILYLYDWYNNIEPDLNIFPVFSTLFKPGWLLAHQSYRFKFSKYI